MPKTWSGFDVLLLFAVWLTCMLISVKGMYIVAGIDIADELDTTERPLILKSLDVPQTVQHEAKDETKTTKHPLAQLIEKNKSSVWFIVVGLLSGVLLAPLTEEFLFRLVLQDYLERKFVRLPNAGLFCAAFIFALLHSGKRGNLDENILFLMLLGFGLANLITFLLGTYYLYAVRKIPIGQYFFQNDWSGRKIPMFAGIFLITIPAVMGLNAVLQMLYPNAVVDPVPIFFFAVVLGWIFQQTRQLVVCVALHAALNAISFAIVLFS
jgi:membrane protease YdiL (CAAX protease family)